MDFLAAGLEQFTDPWMRQSVGGAVLVGICAAVFFLTRRVLLAVVHRLAAASRTTWDDALVEAHVFDRLAYVPPALVAFQGIVAIPDLPEVVVLVVQRVALSVVIAVSSGALLSLLSAVNEVYSANPDNVHRPIKGYLQVVKIFVTLVAVLMVVAVLLDRSPWLFLSGVGAMTAVLLLVFRDTILSLVASIQLTGNDMIRVGDWIEMPQFGADGDVVDVALHTVKVQNWDKTITTTPTHRLISESFKNWRGMSMSGGRRIKRSVSL
ncbi:MAG: mechanosensitive ion channel family protein, partial [Proteobacteria bacterium]|nr:mechanosensitive ion channel family protein [Pseudomonadota bacterium]